MKKFIAVKEKHEKLLFGIPGVVSVGLGYKTAGNVCTGRLAIVVGVIEKLPESKISRKHIIPRSLDGVPTDVIETGRIRTCDNP